MDPKIDKFYSASAYPEFAKWQPEMTEQEAEDYVFGSMVKAKLFHATDSKGEGAIRERGVDTAGGSEIVAFAKGHYMASDSGYAGEFGPVSLVQKALIKNPKRFEDYDDSRIGSERRRSIFFPKDSRLSLQLGRFFAWAMMASGSAAITTRAATARPGLLFTPKQVVTLKR